MLTELYRSLVLLALLTGLTGFVYPFIGLELGHALYPKQAEGSLIEDQGQIIGSHLLGQNFVSDAYFHPRPSAAGSGYDAANSSGSNFGPSSPELAKAVSQRLDALKPERANLSVPVDLVTASGSGLDPDISIASAQFQARRVAAQRHIDLSAVSKLIADMTVQRPFGFLGESFINVLDLNRALDVLAPLPDATHN